MSGKHRPTQPGFETPKQAAKSQHRKSQESHRKKRNQRSDKESRGPTSSAFKSGGCDQKRGQEERGAGKRIESVSCKKKSYRQKTESYLGYQDSDDDDLSQRFRVVLSSKAARRKTKMITPAPVQFTSVNTYQCLDLDLESEDTIPESDQFEAMGQLQMETSHYPNIPTVPQPEIETFDDKSGRGNESQGGACCREILDDEMKSKGQQNTENTPPENSLGHGRDNVLPCKEDSKSRRKARRRQGHHNQTTHPGQQRNIRDGGRNHTIRELPVCEYREKILDEIKKNRITCIQGETGCGKSTMVPQFIMDEAERDRSYTFSAHRLPSSNEVNIIVTQPRRMAAISLAKRVASERKETVGQSVGYKIGGESMISDSTKLSYVTSGLLLQSLLNDPKSFKQYTHVILDEIHERQVDADLLNLVVKLLMAKHPDVKIIVMSATLQGKLFSRYFSKSLDEIVSYSESDSECESESDQILKPIFVGNKRYHVEDIYIDDLVSNSEYLNWLSAKDINNLAEAWVRFNRVYAERYSSEENIPLQFTQTFEHGLTKKNGRQEGEDKLTKLALQLTNNSNENEPRASIMKGFLELCVTLVTNFVRPEEKILIFLPGLSAIYDLFDYLWPLEDGYSGMACPIKLFVLHSQIPREDQEACFEKAPSTHAHVILATNIAESSVTIPNVRVVIDFGLMRQILYDEKRRMMTTEQTWCSMASLHQRAGRAGRVFDGKVVRLIAKNYFQKCLPKYNLPELVTSPLDKSILRVKQLSMKIAGDMSPSDLLKRAVQPPLMEHFDDAVESLADIGAITGNSEFANLTLLGHVALRLPLDLTLSRLVVYGVLFNCTCDAVVMAAALSSRMDPFSLPTTLVMKNPEDFLKSLKRSFKARVRFDNGEYSEPIMYLNMFKAWLKERALDTRYWVRREKFCYDNAVNLQRMVDMESSVCDIASRLHRALPRRSVARRSIDHLLQILRSEVGEDDVSDGEDGCQDDNMRPKEDVHLMGDTSEDNSLYATQFTAEVDKVFCSDTVLLKTLQVAAFNPAFLIGEIGKNIAKDKFGERATRNEKKIVEVGYDPRNTIILNGLEEVLADKDKKEILHKLISFTCDPVRHTGSKSQLILEFEKTSDIDPENAVIHDIPLTAHTMNQYGCGRHVFKIQVPKDIQIESVTGDNIKQIEFRSPIQPYQLQWKLLNSSYPEPPLRCKLNGWRNPIGFACETRRIDHCAVAACLQGTSDPSTTRADGVTVLPPDCDGVLAIVLLMTFLPHQFDIEVGIRNECIKSVKFLGYEFPIPDDNPISGEILVLMNEVRKMLSELLNTSHTFTKMPDSNLSDGVQYLIHKVLSQEHVLYETTEESQPLCTTPFDERQLKKKSKKGRNKLSIYIQTKSEKRNADKSKFVYLKPFGLKHLGHHLGFDAHSLRKSMQTEYEEYEEDLTEIN